LPPNIARRRAIDLIWIKLPGETVGYPGRSSKPTALPNNRANLCQVKPVQAAMDAKL
jgi:hypothetical protein